MEDFLFSLATSNVALSLLGGLLLVALVIGFMPLLNYIPVIGPYVPVAKLVAFLVFGILCALIDRRSADARDQIASLKRDLSFAELQISNSAATAADAARLQGESNQAALSYDKTVNTYEQWLKMQPAAAAGCDDLTDDDVRWLRDVEPRRAAGAGKAGDQSASGLRKLGKGP
jgi:hypothetical protein